MRSCLPVVALLLTACAGTGPRFDPDDPSTFPEAEFQQVDQEKTLDPALLEPGREPFRLGVGDTLQLEVSGHQESIDRAIVMPDGMLYYNLAGGVKAEGLTLPELQERLQAGLSDYYRKPVVSATLLEVNSRRVWVLGNVAEPGLYPLTREMTILDALSAGGGILTSRATGTTIEMADLSHSFIVRDGEMLPVDFEALVIKGDLSQNIYLKPDDYIYLPSVTNQEVFVLGAVRAPRAVGFKENLGLIGALAEAEGPLPGAFYQRMLVVRGSLREPRVAVINYNEVVQGRRADVRLAPGDIVWVPRSPWERLENYLDAVLGITARTIAANEGRRAVLGDEAERVQTTIGVGVP